MLSSFFAIHHIAIAQYQEETFQNNEDIQFSTTGPANVYPSTINVSGLPNNLAYIRVTFDGLLHDWSVGQFDFLLEAPSGEQVVLISDTDPDFFGDPFALLHVDADATVFILEDEFKAYDPYGLPTNIGQSDDYPQLGTITQENPSFDQMQNINPNGVWKLYMVDDEDSFFRGSLNTWSITIGASTIPVCERPIDIPKIDQINRNTARVSWLDSRNTNWDILYLDQDSVPDYNTLPSIENINGQSFNLSGLEYDTEYAVYLRADCDGTNNNPSRWNGPVFFTTETGVCAYAEDVFLCSIGQFNPNIYSRVFFDPCEDDGEASVSQMMYNFKPPKSGDYYFYISSNDGGINSLSIKSQDVVDFCDSIEWHCLSEDFSDDVLLANLDADSTYKLLIHDNSHFDFQISECPEFGEIDLDEFIPHSFDVDFNLTSDELPLAGDVEIYYNFSGEDPPGNNTIPLVTATITDGKISTLPLTLEENTGYELYLRQRCSNGVGCWQGPFDFETDIHCGDISGQDVLEINTTATSTWIQTMDSTIRQNFRYIVMRDSFFEQPAYDDESMQFPIGHSSGGLFVYDLEPNTTYTFYLKLSCLFNDYESQYWQGPFTLETNGDCFVEVENLYCGQCYENELGPRDDPNLPSYNVGSNDLFPGNNPDNCDDLDYDPRLERIFEFNALEDGTISFTRGQLKKCSGSEFLAQYYYKSANLPCDLEDWIYLGCWTHERFGTFDEISFDVKQDSSYYIMVDYAGQLCPGAWDGPNTWIIVEGDNCQNPCEPVQNLTATDNGDGYYTIDWDETPGAIGYDIVLSSAHENVTALLRCAAGAASIIGMHPDNSIVYNVDSVLANISPGVPRSLYVRSRCAVDNYSIWQEVSITPEVAFQSSYTNRNTLNTCSPIYDRTTLSPASDIPYDVIEFTVDATGIYYFSAAGFNVEGAYGAIYENNFDPNNPSQNLIIENEITSNTRLDFSIELAAGVDYIFLANHRVPDITRKLYTLEVDGPSNLSADDFKYRGSHDGPQGIIPPTSGQYYQSNKVCRDDAGWFHFYYSDPDDPNGEDMVLLSVENYYAPDPFFIFANNAAFAGGSFGASLLTNPPADYIANPDGWWTMNRYWDFNITQNLQPEEPVGVRFYYTENDLLSLRNATGNSDLEHEDLNFYKINDPNSDYNLDPADGHAGIPLAPECADIGIWEYFNAPFADTTLWKFDSIPSGYYAEMKVHSFSGGGGGAGSHSPQQDTDMDGYVDAIDCDPNNPLVNPSAVEIPYDGFDNDCNPNTLDDDFDQDGYGAAEDCNDDDPAISPGVPETPYDGIDNDCNSLTPDDDLDQDGFNVAEDCDDNNADINPSAPEIVYDGFDNDCNSETLDDDLDEDGFALAEDCDDENADINPAVAETPYDGIDNDCDASTLDDDLDEDGFALAEDCDDDNADINPAVAETPYDGIDNDCDPLTLDDDLDEDGFLLAEDCDDENAAINPDAEEIPNNGIDEDCDGMDLVTSVTNFPNHLLKIHPNPTASYLFVEENGLTHSKVILYDAMGLKIVETILNGKLHIDLTQFSSGIYFLKVNADEGEVVRKIVKL